MHGEITMHGSQFVLHLISGFTQGKMNSSSKLENPCTSAYLFFIKLFHTALYSFIDQKSFMINVLKNVKISPTTVYQGLYSSLPLKQILIGNPGVNHVSDVCDKFYSVIIKHISNEDSVLLRVPNIFRKQILEAGQNYAQSSHYYHNASPFIRAKCLL